MSEDLTFGVAIKGTGDGSVVTEAKAARDELVSLKQATDDLAASSVKLNASATEDFAALQRSANASAQAWLKGNASADAAADKAWAMANGYKEVDGQLVKLAKSTAEATHMNAGMTREMMVIGHEAVTGNFSKIPGSLMVLANRSGLAASGMIGLGAAIAAPVVALSAFGLAMHEGQQELEAMNRALELTSGYSGQTTSSLYTLAHTWSDTTQLTIGESKNLATQLAASGKIGAESFESVAMAITSYARVSGESIDKVTPKLLKTFEDPTKGAIELNSRMHFLNAAELERIDILQRTGHLSEAQNYLAEAMNVHLVSQTESVGLLASAWHGLGKAASSAWDSMMSVGRKETLDEQINSAKELLLSAADSGNMEAIQRRQLDLAELFKQKNKEVAVADQAAAAAKNITDENEIINLAKQNSELWKKYETSLKISRINGTDAGPAPSMDAVKADASSQLDGSAKLLAEVKKFDDQALESHKDSMMKWVDLWVKGQADLIAKGAYGAAERERHEAAYTTFIAEEIQKRKTAEDAANNKLIQAQQEKFTKMQEQAVQASLTGDQRENARYAAQLRVLERDKKALEDKHLWDLQSEALYQAAMAALRKEHQTKQLQGDIAMVNFGRSIKEGEYTSAMDMAAKMTAGIAGHSRAAFEINKIASTASAIMNTYKGVSGVLAEFPGPIGWAMAAAQAAIGFVQVDMIQSTQFGGGAPNVGGGGVPVTTPSPIAPPSPAQQNQVPTTNGTAAQVATQINLTIVGARDNPDAPLLSYNSFVNDVLPLMQQAKDNGHLIDFNVVMG